MLKTQLVKCIYFAILALNVSFFSFVYISG